MIWLIKTLFFGKFCDHEYYVYDDMFLKMHANREKVEDVNLWHIEQMFTKGFLTTASKSFDEMFTIAATFRKMFIR